MTPARLRAIITTLGWSQRHLSTCLGYLTAARVEHWVAGRTDIPLHVAGWLEGMAALHEANPPPGRTPPQETTP